MEEEGLEGPLSPAAATPDAEDVTGSNRAVGSAGMREKTSGGEGFIIVEASPSVCRRPKRLTRSSAVWDDDDDDDS